MTHAPALTAAPTDDTPVDERPPYAAGPRWPWLAFLALVVLAVVAGVAIVAVLVRAAWRRWRRDDRTEVFMVPTVVVGERDAAEPGTLYRVEFFDGTYPQLTDRRLAVRLVDVYGPTADATLGALARRLADEVDARDSERCFDPAVELYDRGDRLVRRFRAGGA